MIQAKAAHVNRNVFINCPFDDEYRPIFWALIFTVLDCGFVPRCSQEAEDSGEVRIDKIFKIIAESNYGIHDISRTQLDSVNNLPRFNMPLELGIFLGAKKFGSIENKSKACIIFDIEQFRYQKFISDIAGQDISSHYDQADKAILRLRNWLDHHKDESPLPAGEVIVQRYEAFCNELPIICDELNLKSASLSFKNLVYVIKLHLMKKAGIS